LVTIELILAAVVMNGKSWRGDAGLSFSR